MARRRPSTIECSRPFHRTRLSPLWSRSMRCIGNCAPSRANPPPSKRSSTFVPLGWFRWMTSSRWRPRITRCPTISTSPTPSYTPRPGGLEPSCTQATPTFAAFQASLSTEAADGPIPFEESRRQPPVPKPGTDHVGSLSVGRWPPLHQYLTPQCRFLHWLASSHLPASITYRQPHRLRREVWIREGTRGRSDRLLPARRQRWLPVRGTAPPRGRSRIEKRRARGARRSTPP